MQYFTNASNAGHLLVLEKSCREIFLRDFLLKNVQKYPEAGEVKKPERNSNA